MERPDRRFLGRVAWITGAGKGIGAAAAQRFAAEGATVAVLSASEVSARASADACRALGVEALPLWGDAADITVLEASHARIVQRLGSVDVLVNNVAEALSSPLAESSEDHWQRVHDVNFRSVVRCARLVVPGMRQKQRGVIVNISSNHGTRGFPGWGAYASAKGAMMALTRQQAVELASDGIRVVSVTPGATMTPLNEQRFAEAEDPVALEREFVAGIPMRRLASPQEIANAIAFVASDEASFMTGADLLIDGGESIQGG